MIINNPMEKPGIEQGPEQGDSDAQGTQELPNPDQEG